MAVGTRRIVPRQDLEGSIGSGEKRWEKAYIGNVGNTYDTIADMVADLELSVGTAVVTKGYHNISDGGSAFYHIREKVVSDVDNKDTIIFLNNGNVAEKIFINPYHHCYFMPVSNSSALDYGAGKCSVIKTRNGKTIMFDTGMTYSYQLIKETLVNLGITKIDYFVLSHYHGDHWYNIRSLVEDFDFTNTVCYLPKHTDVYPYEEDILSYLTTNTKIYPNSGDTFTVEDITFTFFNCDQADIDYYDNNAANYNDYSMCTYAECGDKTILFTGDIFPTAQERLYNQGWFKKTDVLDIPHHGVTDGVFAPYMQEVMADLSVVSASQNVWTVHCSHGKELPFWSLVGNMYLLGDGLVDVAFNQDVIQYSATGDRKFGVKENTSVTLYLDSSYEGFSNGTPLHPFSSLNDSLALAQKLSNALYVTIEPLSGTYTNADEDVTIKNTNGTVTLKNISVKTLAILSCKQVALDNVTVTGTDNLPLIIKGSIIISGTVEVNGLRSGTGYDSRGVGIYQSKVFLNTLTVKNRSCAIFVAEVSNVCISNFVGESIDYVLADTIGSTVAINNYNHDVCPKMYDTNITQQNPLRIFTTVEYLTSGIDLNTVTKVGQYRISGGGIMQSLVNKPSAIYLAGTLYVTQIESSVLEQRITSDIWDATNGSGVWIRRSVYGTWTAWRKVTTA